MTRLFLPPSKRTAEACLPQGLRLVPCTVCVPDVQVPAGQGEPKDAQDHADAELTQEQKGNSHTPPGRKGRELRSRAPDSSVSVCCCVTSAMLGDGFSLERGQVGQEASTWEQKLPVIGQKHLPGALFLPV